MLLLGVIILLIVVMFFVAILFGAPYLPTMKNQSKEALDLIDLKNGQTLIDLGSGDGRVLKEAAKRGFKVIGYEINPFLVIVSYFVTIKYRKNIIIVWGNYWRKELPKADGIFVFLLPKYMAKLDNMLHSYKFRPIKLVSFAFMIEGKEPVQKTKSMFLYEYK